MDNENNDYVEILNQESPKVEILSHSVKGTAVEAKINKQQVNYLLDQAVIENQSLVTEVEKKNSFYIVLNTFSKETSELGLFKLVAEGKTSFRKVKVEESEQEVSEKPIAIIVHGLVSSISDSYFSSS